MNSYIDVDRLIPDGWLRADGEDMIDDDFLWIGRDQDYSFNITGINDTLLYGKVKWALYLVIRPYNPDHVNMKYCEW